MVAFVLLFDRARHNVTCDTSARAKLWLEAKLRTQHLTGGVQLYEKRRPVRRSRTSAAVRRVVHTRGCTPRAFTRLGPTSVRGPCALGLGRVRHGLGLGLESETLVRIGPTRCVAPRTDTRTDSDPTRTRVLRDSDQLGANSDSPSRCTQNPAACVCHVHNASVWGFVVNDCFSAFWRWQRRMLADIKLTKDAGLTRDSVHLRVEPCRRRRKLAPPAKRVSEGARPEVAAGAGVDGGGSHRRQ